jgi:PAS domain S-box-containing protein
MPDRDSQSNRSPAQTASYLELFDRTQDCVLILNGSGDDAFLILDINTSGMLLFGQSKEKIVGRSLLQWLDPSSRKDFGHAVRVSTRRTDWPRFDTAWKVAEDRIVTMDVSASPLRLPEHAGAIQLIARDVSIRREAEQLIQTLRQKLAMAQTAAGVMPRSGPETSSEDVESSDSAQEASSFKFRLSKVGRQ